MAKQSFATALRSAARTLANDGMPAAVDRRVRERVAMATSVAVGRTRWLIAGGLATAVAVAAAAFVLVGRGQGADHRLAGFELVEASTDLRTEPQVDGVLAVVAGHATVRSDEAGITIATRAPARIRKHLVGIRVIAGAVDVSVAKRHGGDPARVDVSHGAILVMGTRFRIEQRADGGQVWLEEGAIVFVADDGRRRELRPGDSLSWPLPPEPAPREVPSRRPPAPEPPAPEPPHEAPPRERVPARVVPQPQSHQAMDPSSPPQPAAPSEAITVAPSGMAAAAALFREIAELRARGRFREAAEAIERRLDQPGIRDATREIMSFELASILTYQLADTARACAALARHVREYPRSPHAAAVERGRADLGCRDEPGSLPDRRDR